MGKIRGDVLCSVLLKEQYSMKLQHIAATHCSNTHACCSVWLTYFTTAGFPEGLDCTGEQGAGRKPKEG